MRNWDTRDEQAADEGCQWEKDWQDVQLVCRQLDIPCRMVDLSQQYWNRVFAPSLKTWEDGHTPNPDVWCNREVKFGALTGAIRGAGITAPWLAYGHYARKGWSSKDFPGPELQGEEALDGTPRPMLLRPKDAHKDQSYYLSMVREPALSQALFPLGDLTKPEVRELAAKYNLVTAQRDESMGICFIGQRRKFDEFLSKFNALHFSPRKQRY
jgi:tRNA-specific 2-thiouridylase